MGKYQQKNVWLFVRRMSMFGYPGVGKQFFVPPVFDESYISRGLGSSSSHVWMIPLHHIILHPRLLPRTHL
jgi:hypothetical protein